MVGGGVSTFYTEGSGGDLSGRLAGFFNAALGSIPPQVTITCPSGGDTIDSSSGQINGVWVGPAVAPLVGAGLTTYAAGVGMRVEWLTGGINRGRRVKGSTFLVPLSNGAYDVDGALVTGLVTAMQTAATTLVTQSGGDLTIFSKPPKGTHAGGLSSPVVAGRAVDRTSWLRTRRT